MVNGLKAACSLVALGLSLVGLVDVAKADTPNLIVNGGFETGDFTGFVTQNLDATGVTTSGSYNYQSQAGAYFAALGNVGINGQISQTFSDVAGTPLLVSFYYAANGTSPSNLSASFNNSTFFTIVDPIATNGYVQVTQNVVATGSDTLTFSERNDPSYLALDSIFVGSSGNASSGSSGGAPSPEVNTLLGFAIVGGTVTFIRRRRKKEDRAEAVLA